MTPILPILFFIFSAPGILQGLSNMFPPFPAKLARKGYKDRPDLIPSLPELVSMRIRNVMGEGEYLGYAKEAGYDADIATKALDSAQTYMSALDYITIWRRGDLSTEDLHAQLKVLGIHEDQFDRVKQATEYLATPQDVVRFAVRDVFTPSTIAKYGIDQDVPPDYLPQAKRVGLSEQSALWYWLSHWELPSPTQVYEMLHRQLISEDDVDEYLRVADYMPFWRENLRKISYSPLTRVDVRRMHLMGVLNEQEVNKAYRDLGYNEENARRLTQFTIRNNEGKEGEAPSASIIKAYKTGAIERGQAESELLHLNYTLAAINIMLDAVDAEVKQELIDLEADAIVDLYVRGTASLEATQIALTRLGVTSRQMELTLAREIAQARKRLKVASKSDLDSWLRQGIVSTKTYSARLLALGYPKTDIDLYIAENTIAYIHTDKQKYPYLRYVRDYLAGTLDETALRAKLLELEYEQDDIDSIVAIATSAASQTST